MGGIPGWGGDTWESRDTWTRGWGGGVITHPWYIPGWGGGGGGGDTWESRDTWRRGGGGGGGEMMRIYLALHGQVLVSLDMSAL